MTLDERTDPRPPAPGRSEIYLEESFGPITTIVVHANCRKERSKNHDRRAGIWIA